MTEYADLGVVRLAYQVLNPASKNVPLIMVMGWTGVKEDWGELADALAADRPVLTFDNRGMGESTIPEGPYSMQGMAEDVIRLADHVGWTSFHLMGVSMGGMIAQTCALREHGRIVRLILGCTHYGGRNVVRPGEEVTRVLQSGLIPNEQPFDVMKYVRSLLSVNYTPEWVLANPERCEELVGHSLKYRRRRRGVMYQLSAIMEFDVEGQVGSISNETLVIHGTADRLIPYSNGEALARKIPRSKFHPIREAGHIFWNMAPEESSRIVREFLLTPR